MPFEPFAFRGEENTGSSPASARAGGAVGRGGFTGDVGRENLNDDEGTELLIGDAERAKADRVFPSTLNAKGEREPPVGDNGVGGKGGTFCDHCLSVGESSL